MMQLSDNMDEEKEIKNNPQPHSGDVHISAVTFDHSNTTKASALMELSSESMTVGTPLSSPRKMKKDDVKGIFRASTTVGSVSTDQIVRIKKMHDKISDGVNWDFNYSCLITVASIVAGLGLATNSATTVISSMLLSPIMGPVIGMSYGLIIWDLPLIKRSARNELLSILACTIFGVLFGKSLPNLILDIWCTHLLVFSSTSNPGELNPLWILICSPMMHRSDNILD